MRNGKFFGIGFAVLLSLAVVSGYLFFSAEKDYTSTQKLLRFNYVVKNESEKFIAESRFIAAIPMQIPGVQTITSITSSHDYQLANEQANFHTIEFPLKNITPYSSKIIDLTLIIDLSEKPKKEFKNGDNYLKPQKYIEVDSAEIKELAVQLKGTTPVETAKNIHQWLVNNINPSSYTADSKGAAYLIKNKTGDCTEFMYAFIALARANGIPARGISGFWIPSESSLINAADYHDWAEFYDGDRWVLVDSSKQIFDEAYLNYVTGSLFHQDNTMRWKFYSDKSQLVVSQ